MRATLAILALTIVPTAAAAQAVDSTAVAAPPAVAAVLAPGTTIQDSQGQTLGRIEGLLTGPDGGLRQVLVRTGGVARVRSSVKAIPAAGLAVKAGQAVAALTREEAQSLPDVTPPETAVAPPAPASSLPG